jgi:clusterin-associated protein 1
MARVLGYPRLISVENFRQPNFQLLAELLKWLVKRYDPQSDIPTETDTESDRIIFVKSVAQFMATKAHIKLNTKKLYQADGYVVKELLKMTSVLYNALKLNLDENSEDSSMNNNLSLTFDISSQIGDLRRARELASEITSKGASIYDLLGREVDLRDLRTYTINRNLELTDVEKGIKDAVKACQREGEKIANMLDNIQSDEKNLDEKIEKKRGDLERNIKRLRQIKDVRPAYMDEYESLEKELEMLYEEYLVKFRIQSYLEQQLDEYNQAEQEKFEESAKTMQMTIKKMKDQEKERNGNPFMDDDEMLISADSDQSDDQVEKKKDKKSLSKTRQMQQQEKMKQAQKSSNFGTMDAEISGSSDEDGDEDDDDDDDGEEDGLDDEDDGVNDEDDDDAVVGGSDPRNPKAANARAMAKKAQAKDESDSDF